MFIYLVLLFTVLPAVELALLIKIGGYIGVGNTILLIITTGILGAYLARYQGFVVLNKIQQQVNQGLMPSEDLLDGLMILVGGVVLLTPGFVTDTIGFSLLIPLSRSLIKKFTKKYFESLIKKGSVIHFRSSHNKSSPYDDIDIN